MASMGERMAAVESRARYWDDVTGEHDRRIRRLEATQVRLVTVLGFVTAAAAMLGSILARWVA